MILQWLRDKLTVSDVPNRTEICALMLALDPLPESDRMRTRPVGSHKPRTYAEWARKYDTRKAS